jgi:hypothetical protein
MRRHSDVLPLVNTSVHPAAAPRALCSPVSFFISIQPRPQPDGHKMHGSFIHMSTWDTQFHECALARAQARHERAAASQMIQVRAGARAGARGVRVRRSAGAERVGGHVPWREVLAGEMGCGVT